MHTPNSSRAFLLVGLALATGAAVAAIALSTTPSGAQPASKGGPTDAPRAANGGSDDHTMFGGTPARNMVNPTGKLSAFPTAGPNWEDEAAAKKWSDEWVLWKNDLGSRSYGGPIVVGGKVFIGTNNDGKVQRNPRDFDPKTKEPHDKGIILCFDEKTGKFLWQAVFDKLEGGQVQDWPHEGLCSTPTVEGDRLYVVTNRCTVACLDTEGLANGNQGVTTEKYQTPTDADIIWEYDMRKELNVFPHNMSACCPLIVGDIVYLVTANGVDEGHFNIPSPEAPSFIALDKKSGKLLWAKNYPGRNIMHGQWSNPTYAEINGVRQVIFPGGDGWLYGLAPETGEIIWKFDCNPKDGVYELGGTGTRNDFIATPVVHDNKVYIAVGQDPEHTDGLGRLWCIAPTKKGDISDELADQVKGPDGKIKTVGKPNPNSCKVWVFTGPETRPFSVRDFKFGRTMCTACIVDDILYLGELPGYLHCFNAKTGQHYWQYDTKAPMWGSAYYVDGKVLIGNDNGDVFIWKHVKQPETIDELAVKADSQKESRKLQKAKMQEIADKYLLGKVTFDTSVRSTPVVANGVLYVMSEKTLFALRTTPK
jgi:outer membrane protein assembly factor BamB